MIRTLMTKSHFDAQPAKDEWRPEMWILILTIFAGGAGSPAVTAVSGFSLQADCEKAGAAWVQQIEKAQAYSAHPLYLCVKTHA
jgi:hypothetical protein